MHIAVAQCDRYGFVIAAANNRASAESRADFYITCRFGKIRFSVRLPWSVYNFEEDYNMNIRTIGIIIFMGAIMFFSCFAKENDKRSAQQFTSISMDEAAKLMETEKDFILVDVRRPDEYKSGHIPGAVLLTNETITEESASRILKDKNQKILVYCRSGQRSRVAAGKLSSMGYTNVVNIGGIMSWKGKIEK